MKTYDFCGWATKNDVLCSDGRTIRRDAFKHNDGVKVPLVWNHQHNNPANVIGHALLENREEGVYAYGKFNSSEYGVRAKELVHSGEIDKMSIYATQIRQRGSDVMHGNIRELSLVISAANPEALIETVIAHSDESDEEAIIYTPELIEFYHSDDETDESDDETIEDIYNAMSPKQKTVVHYMVGAALESERNNDNVKHSDEENDDDETIEDIYNAMSPKQKTVVHYMVGKALESKGEDENVKHSEGGNENMRKNAFDQNEEVRGTVISHADQENIIALAKSSGVGSLKAAIEIYDNEHGGTLAHGTWENVGELFPDYKDVHPGAPELLERDMSWVGSVMKKARKSPVSKVRTRQADGRATSLRAKGYNDREIEKKIGGSLKLYMRTTDPTTVYVRDTLHRDDIVDITDFDVVAYQRTVMKHNMEETIALAALVGDLREDTDPDKIDEEKIRPIWKDNELYTIHQDIDFAAAKAELQGTDTAAHFGDNYIRAEAMVAANLYASEKYKGKGAKSMYIDPHELNVMLLARDLNGRRIYDSTADLAKAFNVDEIHTVEQFNGLTRKGADGKTRKLLAIVVNMGNYQFGSTKGGELTSFDDFDIKFNTFEYLMETRVSGALTEVFSAIAIEEIVTEG